MPWSPYDDTDETEQTDEDLDGDEEDDDAAASEEDDDEEDLDVDEDEVAAADPDEPEETEAGLAALDQLYRELRGKIRSSSDPVALRSMRAEYVASLSARLSPTTRLRTNDLIELIDERVTDIRATRGGPRAH